jgi:hypothetical protein
VFVYVCVSVCKYVCLCVYMCVCVYVFNIHTGSGSGIGSGTPEKSDPDPGSDPKKIIPDPQHCLQMLKLHSHRHEILAIRDWLDTGLPKER